MRSAADLLDAVVRRDGAAPLITFYDDATGERTELSGTTLANWVAKTANLLRDELDLQPGERVGVRLPAHWQSAAVLLATWSLGAVPVTDPAGVAVMVSDEPGIAAAVRAGARDVLGLSLRPMNAPLARATAGVVDYAAAVLGAGDDPPAGEPGGSEGTAARARAVALGLTAEDRLLVTGAAGTSDAIDWLLAPLAVGASIVLCRHADVGRLSRRAAQERVTATLGTAVEGTRRLDG